MIAAKNAVLDSFGVKIEESTIEQVLRFGTADISKPYLGCITSVAKRYVADIFATLRRYEYNPDLMRLYIVGGGGCLVKHFGQYDENRVTILDDPYFETREREERFVNQIISSVESAMEKTLPIFLAGCMAGLSQVPVAAAPVTQQEPVAELDWDFLGE